MSPIRVGVIGLSTKGWASSPVGHRPALQNPLLSNTYTLTALSTTNPASASEAAAKYTASAPQPNAPAVKGYSGDPAQIAQDPDVDLVVVSVVVMKHKEVVWPVLQARKDVFVEWPLGRDLSEAKEIEQFAREKGVRTMIGLQGMQNPAVLKLRDLINEGAVGDIISTTVLGVGTLWGPTTTSEYEYVRNVKNGATLLSIVTAHFLGAFQLALGDFKNLSASLPVRLPTVPVVDSDGKEIGRIVNATTPDHVLLHGELVQGAAVSIHYRGGGSMGGDYTKAGGVDFYWEIIGTKGTIILKGPGPPQICDLSITLNGVPVGLPEDKLGNIGRAYAEFAKGEKGSYPDFAHAVRLHELLDVIERSAREGKRVDLV